VYATRRAIELGNHYLSKASKGKAGQAKGENPFPPSFVKDYPALTAFMTELKDHEDRPRQLSRLTLFVDAGTLKAVLSDPDQEASLYVTLDCPEEAFPALERALLADEPDWRAWGGGKSSNRKRR
jgi:hypothetical protein